MEIHESATLNWTLETGLRLWMQNCMIILHSNSFKGNKQVAIPEFFYLFNFYLVHYLVNGIGIIYRFLKD